MKETLILAAGVMTFLLFMAWNAARLNGRDREARTAGSDDAPDARRSSAAITAMLRIAAQWRLDDGDLAVMWGGIPVSRIQHWRQQLDTDERFRDTLTADQMAHARHVIAIHEALRRRFSDEAQAARWIYQPIHMPGFDGRAAIELMCRGEIPDLAYVHRCLDSWPT